MRGPLRCSRQLIAAIVDIEDGQAVLDEREGEATGLELRRRLLRQVARHALHTPIHRGLRVDESAAQVDDGAGSGEIAGVNVNPR
jgi:hypothetical protein